MWRHFPILTLSPTFIPNITITLLIKKNAFSILNGAYLIGIILLFSPGIIKHEAHGQLLPLYESPFLVQLKSSGAIPNYYDAAPDLHGNLWVSSENGLYLTNGDELIYANISDNLSTKDIWGLDHINGYIYATGFTKQINLISSLINKDLLQKILLPDSVETVAEKPSKIGQYIWFPIPFGGMLQQFPFGQHKLYRTHLGIKNPVQFCGQWFNKLFFWNGYYIISFNLINKVLTYHSIWPDNDFLFKPKFSSNSKWILVQKNKTAGGTKLIVIFNDRITAVPFSSLTKTSRNTKVRIIPSNDSQVWLDLNDHLTIFNENFMLETWPIEASDIQRIATTPNGSKLLICGKSGIYILPYHLIKSKPVVSSKKFDYQGFVTNDPEHLWAVNQDSLYILNRDLCIVKAWKITFLPHGIINQDDFFHVWGQDYQVFSNPKKTEFIYDKHTGDGIIDTIPYENILFKNLAIKKCFVSKKYFFYYNNFSIGMIEINDKQKVIKTISSSKLLDFFHLNGKKVVAIYPNKVKIFDFEKDKPTSIFSFPFYVEGISNTFKLKDGSVEGNYKSSFFRYKTGIFYSFPHVQIEANSNTGLEGFFKAGTDIFLRTKDKPIFLPQSIIYHPNIQGNPIVIKENLYLRNRNGQILKIKFEPLLNKPINLGKIYCDSCYPLPDGSFFINEKGSPFQIKISDDIYPSIRNSRFKIQINSGQPFYSNNFTLNISYLPPRYSNVVIEPVSNMAHKTVIRFYRAPKWHESYLTYLIVFALSLSFVSYFIWLTQKKTKQRLLLITRLKELDNIAFKARFNPHFLFNSLNSLQLLIEIEDYKKASTYISKLSNLFRNFLKSTHLKFHSLAEEINLLKSYAELQQLKYNNLFSIDFQVPESENLSTWAIPTGIIQPLIENAIKHGIGISPEPNGMIFIRVSRKSANEASIEIIDNGPSRDEKKSLKIEGVNQKDGTGTGLKMIEDRLAVLKEAYQYPCTLSAKEYINFANQFCTRYTINFNPNTIWLKS